VDNRQIADHLRFFAELGVTGLSRDRAWNERPATPPTPTHVPPAPLAGEPDVAPAIVTPAPAPVPPDEVVPVRLSRTIAEALEAVREDIGDCSRCKLHALGRRQIVFGVGNPSADLMFVGEAPGADEDIQGEPFVGRAGQLLTKMIEAMGLSRSDVYIANVLKCRPPENRNPEPDEIAQCEPFLFRQVASIQPKVIIALGAFAARTLLKTQAPISRLRGRVHEYRGAQLVATFHPSFLLRSPGYKREAWQDLKMALALMGREPPGAPGSSPG
jgi:DNA polymerase